MSSPTEAPHLKAMLEAASTRENAATLNAVVVSGMAIDSLATIRALEAENAALRARLEAQGDAINAAYSERNRLVAALSHLFPAYLAENPDPSERTGGWAWIVFVETDEGQLSWHIPDGELEWFDHLERHDEGHWDGHTTEEKYERLARVRALRPAGGVELTQARDALGRVLEHYTDTEGACLDADTFQAVHDAYAAAVRTTRLAGESKGEG